MILSLLGLLVPLFLYLQVFLNEFYQLFFGEVLVLLLLIGGLFLLLLLLGLLELLVILLTLGLAFSLHFVDRYVLWLFEFLQVLWFFEWGFDEFLPEDFSGKRWARIAAFLQLMIAPYFFELFDACLFEFAILHFFLLFFVDLVLPGHSLFLLFFLLALEYSYFLGVNEGL